MDWGRAKTVLIIAFFLLNLLLGYQLWFKDNGYARTDISKGNLTEEARRVMQFKQISLDTTIPSETPKLQETLKSDRLVDVAQTKELEETVDSRIVFEPRELESKLGHIIPKLSQYQFDPLVGTAGVFVLYQLYDGLPLFDVKLELLHMNQQIRAYTQSYVEVQQGSENNEQNALPANMAVGHLIENYLPIGAKIRDIKLGYHGQSYDSETHILAPSWRIMLESGEIYYVHAISGAVIEPVEVEQDEE